MKIRIFFCFTCLLVLYSCKVVRFGVYNFADIRDYKKFPSRQVKRGSRTFEFSKAKSPQNLPKIFENKDTEDFLMENKTVAFLVIQNDTIKYEKYFQKYNGESIVPSFSMAKSITSILIGCAIDEGVIKSINEPITNYIPELSKNGFERVKIVHLLQMTSGIKYNEGYANPFGNVATFYYGTNLQKAISKLKLANEPGKEMKYASGNTQLLGLVLERALKNKTVSRYLEEKLWIPLQMEFDASWSLDKKKQGLEKTFCCINARARDFAKIGRLFLNGGRWGEKQIVSKEWVEESIEYDTSMGSAGFYQYQWWIPSTKGDFMARGILGQFIYINPEKNLIIVRLGKKRGQFHWVNTFQALAKYY